MYLIQLNLLTKYFRDNTVNVKRQLNHLSIKIKLKLSKTKWYRLLGHPYIYLGFFNSFNFIFFIQIYRKRQCF